MFKPSLSIRSFPLAFEIAQVFPIREKMTWPSFFLYPLFLFSYISNILKERSKFIVPPFSPHLNPWHTLVWCPISALFVYAYKLFFIWKNRRNNKEKHNKYPHNQQLLLSHFSRIWLCATPSTASHQTPLSLGFSRQEYWSGFAISFDAWKW